MLAGVGRPRSAGMEEAAAALAEMDATEEEDVVDPVEAGRQRASQLAQQFPMRNAFSGVTPIAHIRLEAVGQLDWEVRHLSCPAATSVGQLKQVGGGDRKLVAVSMASGQLAAFCGRTLCCACT